MDNNQRIEITKDKLELKHSWGDTSVITHAFCKITEQNGHAEIYQIQFIRNQITGAVHQVTCLNRGENTTEHTLTTEAVEEICLEELESC